MKFDYYSYSSDGEALYAKLLKHKIGYDVDDIEEEDAQKEFESDQNPFCGTTMCTRCPLYFTSTVSQCVSIYTNLRELHHDDLLTKSPELFL
jgi:hypothetical protein